MKLAYLDTQMMLRQTGGSKRGNINPGLPTRDEQNNTAKQESRGKYNETRKHGRYEKLCTHQTAQTQKRPSRSSHLSRYDSAQRYIESSLVTMKWGCKKGEKPNLPHAQTKSDALANYFE